MNRFETITDAHAAGFVGARGGAAISAAAELKSPPAGIEVWVQDVSGGGARGESFAIVASARTEHASVDVQYHDVILARSQTVKINNARNAIKSLGAYVPMFSPDALHDAVKNLAKFSTEVHAEVARLNEEIRPKTLEEAIALVLGGRWEVSCVHEGRNITAKRCLAEGTPVLLLETFGSTGDRYVDREFAGLISSLVARQQ